MSIKRELFACQCGDPSHQFVVSSFDGEEEIYIEIHLYRGNFWERLRNGLKYIFGRPCIYGDFDEVILSSEDQARLKNILSKKVNNNVPLKCSKTNCAFRQTI